MFLEVSSMDTKVKNILTIIFLIIFTYSQNTVLAQKEENFVVSNYCIGKICIGDKLETVRKNYSDYIIKTNESNTGYYIFDNNGNFMIEFSSKKSMEKTNAPILYIMTSNPSYKIIPDNIHLDLKVSELSFKYGAPKYHSGPDGYSVTFPKWSIKDTVIYKNYKVNFLVGIYNLKLEELFHNSESINEEADIKLLKTYPEYSVLNTIEIYSDYYKDNTPIK